MSKLLEDYMFEAASKPLVVSKETLIIEALTQIVAEWVASGGKVSPLTIDTALGLVDEAEVDRRVNAEELS